MEAMWVVYMSLCCRGARHLYEVDWIGGVLGRGGGSSYLRDRCVSKKSGIPISDINWSTHQHQTRLHCTRAKLLSELYYSSRVIFPPPPFCIWFVFVCFDATLRNKGGPNNRHHTSQPSGISCVCAVSVFLCLLGFCRCTCVFLNLCVAQWRGLEGT